jgi:hypothetical protein
MQRTPLEKDDGGPKLMFLKVEMRLKFQLLFELTRFFTGPKMDSSHVHPSRKILLVVTTGGFTHAGKHAEY